MSTSDAALTRKREKELQEQRASGNLPPEMDVSSGKLINPHNPEFITKRPWYLGDSGPSLVHHASKKAKNHVVSMAEADEFASRRRQYSSSQEVVPKGAWIEAMYRGKTPYLPAKVLKTRLDGTLDLIFEHGKTQTNVPRSQAKLPKSAAGARAGLDGLGKIDWDAKRDRWHGYDASRHTEVHERFAEIEAARAKKRESERLEKEKKDQGGKKTKKKDEGGKKTKKKTSTEASSSEEEASDTDDSDVDDADSDESGDEFQLGDDEARDFQGRVARQGGVGGAQMKTTVRNLRIREDTAKYLRNLDPDSAYYDPKSRAMRENPTPHIDPKELLYAGDNFARATGDAVELAKAQVFAWDAKTGLASVVEAEPSRAELLRKTRETKAIEEQKIRAAAVEARYGSAAQNDDECPDEHRLRSFQAQSEVYREFKKDGSLKVGGPIVIPTSKYLEDHFPNNHRAVWGSFFCPVTFQWGFADDHSTIKNSFATGESGKLANDKARLGLASDLPTAAFEGKLAVVSEEATKKKKNVQIDRDSVYGVPDFSKVDLDENKVKEAMKRQRDGADLPTPGKKYNSQGSTSVTLEDMEAYRRTKITKDDPMRDFLS